MNRSYVLAQLREARGAVGQLIADMEADADCDFGEFSVDTETERCQSVILALLSPYTVSTTLRGFRVDRSILSSCI